MCPGPRTGAHVCVHRRHGGRLDTLRLDEEKVETRHAIDALEEIYRYSDEIREAVRRYK